MLDAKKIDDSGKSGGRNESMVNVSVTLPVSMLDRLDSLIEKGRIASRSQAARDALTRYLKSIEMDHD